MFIWSRMYYIKHSNNAYILKDHGTCHVTGLPREEGVTPFLMWRTLREESSQSNVILQYKLLASILSAVCSVIQQPYYLLHFHYTLYDGKYECKITTH